MRPAVALTVAAALSACGGESARSTSVGTLIVATTVSPITSIVSSVAGDRAEVRGIVPEGTNSHTFEPKPNVAELVSTADLIFINGLKLEDPTRELAESNMKDGAAIVELGTSALPEKEWIYDFSFPKADRKPNPHLWTDPRYAMKYADEVGIALTKADPDGAATYRANVTAFHRQMRSLDAALRVSFASIPAKQRKLLTYHDAYAYFAKDYGFEVIGAIQVSDFEEPTPREVANLIDQIKAERVPAIFGSEVFPSPVLQQIGRETGVRYVDSLRDDDLPGRPGDPQHSLLGLLRFNYSTVTKALGGDPSAIDRVNVAAPVDNARYPQ